MEGMTATPEHPLGWHLFRLPGHSNRAAIGMRHLPLRAQRALKGMGLIGKKGKTAVFQKQFPFNYTKSSKVEQKYSISPLKCLQSVILKSEVSIMQCKGSTKSTVSGRFKIIVAEISGVICGVKIQVAAAANMK